MPKYDNGIQKFLRNGFIGFSAAVLSDCCSNSLRVIKTTKQTNKNTIPYLDTTKLIIKEDGISGLFGRGLKTRILTNGLQGIIFTITWKFIEEKFSKVILSLLIFILKSVCNGIFINGISLIFYLEAFLLKLSK